MDTTADLEPPRTTLDAGQESRVTLSVRNDSEIVEDYTFQVVGDLAEWSSVEPTHVSVYPGQTSTAVVTLRPPRTSAVSAGEHPYGVHVLPAKRPENAAVPEGVVELLPFYETVAELSPQSTKSRRGGTYQVAVDNRGNAPVAVALAAKSASDGLGLALSETEQTMDPGARWTSEIRAEPVKRLWRGAPVAYPFTVVVTPEEGPELPLAGTQYQDPVVSAWVPKGLMALAAAALAVFIVLQLMPDVVEVPAVAGTESTAAEATLSNAKLVPQVREVFHARVPDGTAVESEPAAGTQVEEGTTVVLTVSKGRGPSSTVAIPAVAGTEVAAAEAALRNAQLNPVRDEVENENVPAGKAVGTDPKADTMVEKGTTVVLTISTGPPGAEGTSKPSTSPSTETPQKTEKFALPEVARLEVSEAEQKLYAENLVPQRGESVFDETVPSGHVVSTEPAAGTEVAKGDTVVLTVSQGPPAPVVVVVPDVLEMEASEAEQKLYAENLVPQRGESVFDETV
ncbi:PASTA domain-containing protein, partial [Kocuria rhizosphaericola]|uniref:PASTA domain-containing protein n=1 Tax=Kocuria rhizosphaericola TaxID=3376284 RepID=UPI003795A28A